MPDNLYNKLQKIYINNYQLYKVLSKRQKRIYDNVWNEVINTFINDIDCNIISFEYKDAFCFSSELNLLFIKDGFNIKISKDNRLNYIYELSISREHIDAIINQDETKDEKTKTLQK